MQDERIARLVHEQSRIGRRVILLLGYLAEHGPSSKEVLASAFPSGLKGEVMVAKRQDYISKNAEGKYFLKSKGREVINWLLSGAPLPSHWTAWESAARAKQQAVVVIIKPKHNGHKNLH